MSTTISTNDVDDTYVDITIRIPKARADELLERSVAYQDIGATPDLRWTITKAMNRHSFHLKRQLDLGRTFATSQRHFQDTKA